MHRHRPRFCSACQRQCCRPAATFTRSLPFVCDLDLPPPGGDHLWRLGAGAELLPPAGRAAAAVTHKVMWVKDCVCGPCEQRQGDAGAAAGGSEDAWGESWEGFKAQQLMGGDIDGDEAL